MDDGALVESACKGDTEAFAALVGRYANAVYGVAYHRVGDYHLAQDIAQEVFVKAYIKLHGLRQPEKVGSWLYSIADRMGIDWQRANREVPCTHDPMDGVHFDHTAIEVRQALDSLPERTRLPVILYHLNGYSTKETAGFMGISVEAVESRLRRARRLLRKELLEMVDGDLASNRLDRGFEDKVRERTKALGIIRNLVTFHHGQNYAFNGCMQYLMECLGEDKGYDYWFFSGVTGDSFTQVHRRDHTAYTCCLTQDAFGYGMAKTAFDACGYGFTYVDGSSVRADQPRYLRMVVESIDRGIPVISRGCEGTGEFSVICGYDDFGKALLYLKGDDPEPTPYGNHLEWDLVFVGDKKAAPPIADVYRNAVMAIPSLVAMTPMNGLTFGKQAFNDWAESFSDGRFADVPEEEIDPWRVHGTFLCMCGTNGCSRGFLAKALEFCPDLGMIDDLLPIYERMQGLFEVLQGMEGGFGISPKTIKDVGAMEPICTRILELAGCCDEILGVFGV